MSNLIRLIDDYYIKCDKYNYILVQRRLKADGPKTKADGSTIDAEIGYYATLDSLLDSLSNRITREKILSDELTTVDEIVEHVRQLRKTISGIQL